MKNLTNNVVIQVNSKNISFLQFKILNELGIKNAYSLKDNIVNFRHSKENLQIEKESYQKLCTAIGLDCTKVTKPMQDHTNVVKRVDVVYTPENLQKTDGLITDKQDIILATTNADCILYLLYDKKKHVIGNIHSGWKGSYQGIIAVALDQMKEKYKSNMEDIIVCICPSIRRCCFEVDQDVKDMFYKKYSYLDNIDEFIESKGNGKFHIDTVGINNVLIQNKGILKENIFDANICSVCNSDVIQSYRIEGKEYKLATAVLSM